MEQKKIAVYDFDGTITNSDSLNDFIIYTFGIKRFLFFYILNFFNVIMYLFGLKKNDYIKSKFLTYFYRDRCYKSFIDDCNKYANNRLPRIINQKMLSEIRSYQKNGFEIIILSASFAEWIIPWARKQKIQNIIGTQLEVVDGKITGNVPINTLCYGKNKVKMLLEKVDIQNKNYFYAYGDSKADQYFMNLADEAFYIKGKKILKIYPKNNVPVIVTDGLWRKSMSVIRSLGKKNVDITVLGDSIFTTGMWSRYTKRRYKFKTAKESINDFDKGIRNVINSSINKPVIFAMEDATMEWCMKNRKYVDENTFNLLPSIDSFNIAEDKSLTLKKAMEIGISCPKTFFPNNVFEVDECIKKLDGADFVLKPYVGSGSSGIVYCNKRNLCDYKTHWEKYGPYLIQERIPKDGIGIGVSIIMDKQSNVVAYFSHKRLQQYPNSGGPSTSRTSFDDQELVEQSIKILKSLSWVGVAMVEWKININTGKPVLMEINPRFWGSLELAVRSDVDFPYLYYQLALGRNVEPVLKFKKGVICRWMIPGDILRFLSQDKKKREPLKVFLNGSIRDSEEWDKTDKRGYFASIICQFLLSLNPKYWKYVRRK